MAAALPTLVPLPEPEPTNLARIAQECIDATPSLAAAIDQFVRRVQADPALLEEIVSRHLRTVCGDIVRKVSRDDTRILDGRRDRPPRTITAGEFADAVTLSMLDYRINGRRIGDLVRPELLTMAAGLETQAADVLIKARWLRLIANKMPGDTKPVQEVLTSDILETLRNEARGQV